MDRLPQEIYDKISACFSDKPETHLPLDRSPLAVISRKWQAAIERQTFRQIKLKNTANDLTAFKTIVCGSRRHYLRTIEYTILLPSYEQEAYGKFEREPERHINDEVFTTALYDLFHSLRSWDVNKGPMESEFRIRLDIKDVYSPTDKLYYPVTDNGRLLAAENRTQEPRERNLRNRNLGGRRFWYSYLRLLRPKELPIVPAVREFEAHRTHRNLAHHAAIEIAAAFPNLSQGDWYMADEERRYPALRRTNRTGLTQTIRNLLPRSSLRYIRICMGQRVLYNHGWRPAHLSPPGAISDPLCSAIQEATSQCKGLTTLIVRGTLDPSLLWPNPSPSTLEPFWQNMEHLHIHFHMTTPTGAWYFRAPSQSDNLGPPVITPSDSQLPPGYGSSEEDDIATDQLYSGAENMIFMGLPPSVFRAVPAEELIRPLVESFGKACAQMPLLKVASLSTLIPKPLIVPGRPAMYEDALWGIWFAVPGASFHIQLQLEAAFRDNTNCRRLVLDTNDWRPDDRLLEMLENIGRERYTGDIVVTYADYWNAVTKSRRMKELTQEQNNAMRV